MWYHDVKVGDLVSVDQDWNRTERLRVLEIPTKVLAIIKTDFGQTGWAFRVKAKNGHEFFLDAGWFTPFKEANHE